MIPRDCNSAASFKPQNNVENGLEIFDVIYDENPVALWGSDYETDDHLDLSKTKDGADVQPVFTKCFAAGFRLSTDPPAPHIEDLTVVTIETGVELTIRND
jgi:hypothetical protein